MCQRHHPPPGSVTGGKRKKRREEGEVYRVKEGSVCVLLLVCLSGSPAWVALHLRTESASITGEAVQSPGPACQPLPPSTKRVNFSGGSAP
ncbi:ATP-dependent RNA helicase DBP7 [Dissostichus eleginoides]|uniref:ATP-dependent RNA helicase DBP7 n=1 Tax=Dissostichus eleginoides TaxID=100907 RepID=A0AAD9CTC5_DISEL|nr:ATP-dependent RNA helicase DBP7 [Dissostichus eleginoides]